MKTLQALEYRLVACVRAGVRRGAGRLVVMLALACSAGASDATAQATQPATPRTNGTQNQDAPATTGVQSSPKRGQEKEQRTEKELPLPRQVGGVRDEVYVPSRSPRPDADPRQVTFERMDRFVSAAWEDAPLREVLRDIAGLAQVEMDVTWVDEDNPDVGLREARRISLRVERLGLLDVLERVLDKADTRADGRGSTWQLSETGVLQVGPRERLDHWMRTDAYDVADLLLVIEDGFLTAAALVWKRHSMMDDRPVEERAESLRTMIIKSVEPDVWVENGGKATIVFELAAKAFVVRAPDYAHRAAFGYQFREMPRREQATPTKPIAPRQGNPSAEPKKQGT